MPTWVPIYSANYSELTWVSGNVSSVASHSSLNTYVIGRPFGRKLQKRLKHMEEIMPTWVPIHSVNYSELTGVSGNVSSVARHNSLNTYVIGRPFGRKLQKRPKHMEEIMPTWVPIHSVNYSELTGISATMSSVARHNSLILLSLTEISNESYRKG